MVGDESVGMKGAKNTLHPVVYVVLTVVEDDVTWTDAIAVHRVVVFVMFMVVVVDVNSSIAHQVPRKEGFVSLMVVGIDVV